jgi:lipid A 3-O-deacylase
MKKLAILGAALSISCLSVDAAELTSAVGATSQGGGTARLALGFDWEKSWFQTSIGKVTGYWDLGYTYWQAGDQAGGRHSVLISGRSSILTLKVGTPNASVGTVMFLACKQHFA